MRTGSSTRMPSTSRRAPLTLSLRRAEVTAFWTFATLLIAAAAATAARMAGAPPWMWTAAAILAPAPGVFWSSWFVFAVRAWNKAACVTASLLRRYVLFVSYYVLFSSLGVAGSSLALKREAAERSRWSPHRGSQPSSDGTGPVTTSVRAVIASARRPGCRWMLMVLPMMVLLRMLGDEESTVSPSSSTYTLY
jgi:hypothetical protein